MLYNTTMLGTEKLKEIQALETDLGKTLIALTAYEARATELSEDQLSKIQKAEQKMGIVLLAVDA